MPKHKFEGVASVRLDAQESIHFERQLQHIKARIWEIDFPTLKARQLIPVSRDADPGDNTIVYREFEKVGVAKIISSYADDLPRIDVTGTETVSVIRSIGASYGFSRQEIRASAKAGTNLSSRKAADTREAFMREENSIALIGAPNYGIPTGLINNANSIAVTLPADGAGSTTEFVNKTADQIIRDLLAIIFAPFENTFGIEEADTMLLPLSVWRIVNTTPRGNTDTSILEYVKKNAPFMRTFDWLNELTDAGAGGEDRILVYKADITKVSMEIPMDFTEYEPQPDGLEWVIPTEGRTGGVIFYKPLSSAFTDDATT
jgi:hypothetical protein